MHLYFVCAFVDIWEYIFYFVLGLSFVTTMEQQARPSVTNDQGENLTSLMIKYSLT